MRVFRRTAYPHMKPTRRLMPFFEGNMATFDFLLERFGTLPEDYERSVVDTYLPEVGYEQFSRLSDKEKKALMRAPGGLIARALKDSAALDSPPGIAVSPEALERARKRVGQILGTVALFADDISDSIQDEEKSKSLMTLRDFMLEKAREPAAEEPVAEPALARWTRMNCKFAKGKD